MSSRRSWSRVATTNPIRWWGARWSGRKAARSSWSIWSQDSARPGSFRSRAAARSARPVAVHPSHEQEQALIRDFFAGEISGTFVEVGANHPTFGSQTWHLEQAGWTGVLVEPQPDLAAVLAASRNAQVFAVACTSPDN